MLGRVINLADFRKTLSNGKVENVYLALGTESLLLEEVDSTARKLLVEPEFHDFDLDVFCGDELTGQILLPALSALPMMSARRLVIIKKAESLSAGLQKLLLSYLGNPSPTCVLIILIENEGKIAWIKDLTSKTTVIRCDTPKRKSLEEWIRRRAESLRVSIDDTAIALMTENRRIRLIDLASELEKASLLVDAGGVITGREMQQIWGITPELDIWGFFDHFASGKRLVTLREFCLMRDDFEKQSAGFVLSQVFLRFRLVLKESFYNRKKTPYNKRIWSGTSQKQWNMASRDLKTLPPEVAVRAINSFLTFDRLRKTTQFSVSSMFERLIHQIGLDREELS